MFIQFYLVIGVIAAGIAFAVMESDTECQLLTRKYSRIAVKCIMLFCMIFVMVTWPIWLGFYLTRFLKK